MKIPNGHQAVMPYLIVDGVDRFIDFVTVVFNAEITYRGKNKDGSSGHCEMNIGGSTIMFSNNKRGFKLDSDGMAKLGLKAEEITQKTLSPDFARNRQIHNCWLITAA